MDEIMGWKISWVGPKDYRCEICHMGFTDDETVYILTGGLPFHRECVDPSEFYNRVRKGVSIITPGQRKNP